MSFSEEKGKLLARIAEKDKTFNEEKAKLVASIAEKDKTTTQVDIEIISCGYITCT